MDAATSGLSHNSPGQTVVLERDPVTGQVLSVDGDISRLLGLTEDTLIAPGAFVDRVHRLDLSRVAPATSDDSVLEYRLRHADGHHIWVTEEVSSLSTENPGAVVSQLCPAEPKVRLAQLEAAVGRFSDAVVVFELADEDGSVVVVAANEAGEELVGAPGAIVRKGDLPDLQGEDGDIIDLLAQVIANDDPFALVLSDLATGAPASLSAECLDTHTGLVLLRQYVELSGVASTPSALCGAKSGEPGAGLSAQLLEVAAARYNDSSLLDTIVHEFDLDSLSAWQLDVATGEAKLLRAADGCSVPASMQLSGAAISRLSNLTAAVSQPDPAVLAIRRRLDLSEGHTTVATIAPNVILVGNAPGTWESAMSDQFELVARFVPVDGPHMRANSAPRSSDDSTLAEQRNDLINSVSLPLLTASDNDFYSVVDVILSGLSERIGIAEMELWEGQSDGALRCVEQWSTGHRSARRDVYVAIQGEDSHAPGVVRFIGDGQANGSNTFDALEAVAELLWQASIRVRTERSYTRAFEDAPLAVAVRRPDGRIHSCNQRYADFLGFDTTDRLLDTQLARHATIDGRDQLETLLASGKASVDNIAFRRPDESIVWGRVHVSSTNLGPDGSFTIVQIEDVTQSVIDQRALQYRVDHDYLTLLATRQCLTHAISEPSETGVDRTLLLVDLNRFETIRDRYGRDQADQVLRVVGDRLRTLVRPDDLVARTGPAEFAVLLNGDEADACALADRLLARIAEPVLVRHTEINTTANIGVANVDARDDVGVVLRKADSALDAAKTAGHMCSATFDSTLHEQLEREERLEADLPAALETGQITMHFHPEVSLRTGELLGFEALARWEHPDLGLLQSEEFVGHADRIGLIRDIDDLALRTACTQMADWQRQYPDRVRSIRVNVSGSSIRSDSYVELARDLLESSQIPPESLWLEVSERELLIDGEPPLERLNDLHDIGCKILVDNFGHGLGSFSLLRKLPVDAVKIQAELIGALGVDPDASTIVSATIQLASTLGLECTAEGVESIRQAQELIELGCQRAHGHLYGEARPAAELGRIIAEGRVAPKGT